MNRRLIETHFTCQAHMIFNFWLNLCILEQENQTVSPSHAGCGQHYQGPVPHPYPLTISVHANHDFQMVCLSQSGLNVGRSEVRGITSLGMGSQHMTDGNWWLSPQLSYFSHADLRSFSWGPTGNSLANDFRLFSILVLLSYLCFWEHLWHKPLALRSLSQDLLVQ